MGWPSTKSRILRQDVAGRIPRICSVYHRPDFAVFLVLEPTGREYSLTAIIFPIPSRQTNRSLSADAERRLDVMGAVVGPVEGGLKVGGADLASGVRKRYQLGTAAEELVCAARDALLHNEGCILNQHQPLMLPRNGRKRISLQPIAQAIRLSYCGFNDNKLEVSRRSPVPGRSGTEELHELFGMPPCHAATDPDFLLNTTNGGYYGQ